MDFYRLFSGFSNQVARFRTQYRYAKHGSLNREFAAWQQGTPPILEGEYHEVRSINELLS